MKINIRLHKHAHAIQYETNRRRSRMRCRPHFFIISCHSLKSRINLFRTPFYGTSPDRCLKATLSSIPTLCNSAPVALDLFSAHTTFEYPLFRTLTVTIAAISLVL
jgi:hypothetical protein